VKRALLLFALLGAACRQDMHDQPRFEPLEATSLFEDGRASRPRVTGTVARGERTWDAHLMEGKVAGELATSFPMPITAEVLARGQERFDIFCSACHDRAGTGNGIVVQRGLKQPPSLHIERLRAASPGYFYDVITRGFGAMYDLSDKLAPADRWAVVAYVRALQRSQNATLADVTPQVRERLEREAGR
jgi:mono/diheme cytochrome c family protein